MIAELRGYVNRLQGHRVKKLREERKLTQRELGTLIGMDGQQMIRYEKNQTNPDSSIVAALATALGTTSDYLIGLTDDPSPRLIIEELSAEERTLIIALRKGESSDAIQAFAALTRKGK